jgi:hypothetical protein
VSDFGKIAFVADRFASARDALIVDPEYADLAVGEAMTPFDLATTGLAKRKALRTELTLRCSTRRLTARSRPHLSEQQGKGLASAGPFSLKGFPMLRVRPGGTVTQATSKSTGVTLDMPSGVITMNGAALGRNTSVASR